MVWPGVVFSGEEFSPSPEGGLEWCCFVRLSPLIHGISPRIPFCNNYEGSILFTRSIFDIP